MWILTEAKEMLNLQDVTSFSFKGIANKYYVLASIRNNPNLMEVITLPSQKAAQLFLGYLHTEVEKKSHSVNVPIIKQRFLEE